MGNQASAAKKDDPAEQGMFKESLFLSSLPFWGNFIKLPAVVVCC